MDSRNKVAAFTGGEHILTHDFLKRKRQLIDPISPKPVFYLPNDACKESVYFYVTRSFAFQLISVHMTCL